MTNEIYQEAASVKPDIAALKEHFDYCSDERLNNLFSRRELNHNARYCYWSDQSDDGKKWKPKGSNDEVFPWEGASDARVHLVDMYIREDQAFLETVFRRARLSVLPTEINDAAYSARLTNLLRWLVYTQMKEVNAEMRLAANWYLQVGAVVVGVFWDQLTQLARQTLDMETIIVKAQEATMIGEAGRQQGIEPKPELTIYANLPNMILDPMQEDQAAEGIRLVFSELDESRAKKVVKQLRAKGIAEFPRPYLRKQQPCIVTLCPNEEIFLPPEATDLQLASGIYRIESVSETTLRERVNSAEWDETFVQQVIETQRGVSWNSTQDLLSRNPSNSPRNLLDKAHSYEIVHAYRRLHDSDGVPGIYYTVFHPQMTTLQNGQEAYGAHLLLNYDHGEYPFVLFEREKCSRLLTDSRGYGEVGSFFQNMVKAEWDSRIDRASIATIPPLLHPPASPPAAWGPGARCGVSRPDMYKFADIPEYDVGSKDVEKDVRAHSDRYFGHALQEEQNQVEAGLLKQSLADNWMHGWTFVFTQIVQLEQQFGSDEIYYRVVGDNKGQALKTSREEIQGNFDIRMHFNTDNLDRELLAEKIGLMEKALTWDISGRADRDEIIGVAFELIDPNLGERVLKPSEEAAQAEIEDEQAAFAKIWSGIQVDVKPGQSFQMRLNWLQQMLAQNVSAQQRYGQDEHFKNLVDTRLKQLNHQVEQFTTNAQIGRLGA